MWDGCQCRINSIQWRITHFVPLWFISKSDWHSLLYGGDQKKCVAKWVRKSLGYKQFVGRLYFFLPFLFWTASPPPVQVNMFTAKLWPKGFLRCHPENCQSLSILCSQRVCRELNPFFSLSQTNHIEISSPHYNGNLLRLKNASRSIRQPEGAWMHLGKKIIT